MNLKIIMLIERSPRRVYTISFYLHEILGNAKLTHNDKKADQWFPGNGMWRGKNKLERDRNKLLEVMAKSIILIVVIVCWAIEHFIYV